MAFSAILKIYTASLGAAFKTHPPDPKRTLCSCNRCSVKTKHLNACFLTAGSFGVEEPSLRLTNCVQKRCRLEHHALRIIVNNRSMSEQAGMLGKLIPGGGA